MALSLVAVAAGLCHFNQYTYFSFGPPKERRKTYVTLGLLVVVVVLSRKLSGGVVCALDKS